MLLPTIDESGVMTGSKKDGRCSQPTTRRVLFRVWVVGSMLWAIIFIVLLDPSINDFEEFASLHCDTPDLDPGLRFADGCYYRYISQESGWLEVIFPPILAIIVGWIVLRMSARVARQ